MTEFIFMLTHNDRTVPNALDVIEQVKDSGLTHIGFKDVGATPEFQRRITQAARAAGMTVYLECVSTTLEDETATMHAAVAAGVDWVLGGTFVEESAAVLAGSGIHFAPFPGEIVGHPSELRGSIDDIAAHAARQTAIEGVRGVDILAYRHRTADIPTLIESVVAASDGPVIVAGSVTTQEQIAVIDRAGAWGFTIGGAIFDGALPGPKDVRSQVATALSYAAGSQSVLN